MQGGLLAISLTAPVAPSTGGTVPADLALRVLPTATTYDIGDLVFLTVAVSVDGVPTDPTALAIDVMAPDGTVTHATLAGGGVIRDAVGAYTYPLAPTDDGRWRFKWWASGNVQAAEQGAFRVRWSRFP